MNPSSSCPKNLCLLLTHHNEHRRLEVVDAGVAQRLLARRPESPAHPVILHRHGKLLVHRPSGAAAAPFGRAVARHDAGAAPLGREAPALALAVDLAGARVAANVRCLVRRVVAVLLTIADERRVHARLLAVAPEPVLLAMVWI